MKEKIQSFIHGNGFFKSVLKVGSGNLIGQGIAIITTPILSRIYNDIAYGDRAMIVSTAAIIINLSTLGLNSAIMKPKEDEESKRVFTTALYLNIAVSTIAVLVCFVLNSVIHLIDVSGSYFVALILMWLYMIAYTAQSLVLIYTNRKGRYNRLFFNPIIGAVANIVLAIPLGLAGFGYEGFLITTIVSQAIQVIHMAWNDMPIYKRYRLKDLIYVLKTYKEYIIFQYPSNFLMNTGNEYPTQFLGRNFTSQELGNYSMCLNIMKYPIRLIAGPVSTVYFRTATEYHRQGKNLADFTYKLISKILLISFVPVAICCVFSERIFAFTLGSTWAAAGTIAAIKAVEYVMLFCADCVGYCRVSIGKQKSNLLYAATKIVVIIIFSTAGYSMFHSLMGTIAMITVGNTLLNIFDIAIDFYHLDKKYLLRYALIALSYTFLITGIVLFKYLH
nr:oligosaccharide flippase family protein [Clostridia bacterium]